MSEGESGGTDGETPNEDAANFFEIANLFLAPANDMAGEHDIAEIAAAFIYGCSRYNAFAMQAQTDDLAEHREEAAEMLTGYWTNDLREHMGQSLQRDPAPPPAGVSPTDAIDVLKALESRDRDGFSAFMDMADQFINVANATTAERKVSRLSACCMHACARFNVFVMQASGLKPGVVDEALIERFTAIYRQLVDRHLLEVLVAPKQ